MSQRLCIILSSPSSEVAKDLAIEAAATAAPGVTEGAATIVRDANGKVIEVRITIPDSAISAVQAAVSAVPGVANLITEDITSGFEGIDGTQDSVDNFVARGGNLTVSANITEVYGTDSVDITYATIASGSWNLAGFGALSVPAHSNPFIMEARLKAVNAPVFPTLNYEAILSYRNLGTTGKVTFRSGSPSNLEGSKIGGGGANSNFTGTDLFDGSFHVMKLTMTGTKLEVYLDDVFQTSLADFDVPATGLGDSVALGLAGFSGSSSDIPRLELDFVRWTEKV